ncbi:hypothetical protein ACK3BE_32375 (plasmid) [Pseudomonas mandelii]|uniref:hypothetical protein n=1 Tax=Pseudomonas mandelii TaxID=75612 RepID=UPI00398D67D4
MSKSFAVFVILFGLAVIIDNNLTHFLFSLELIGREFLNGPVNFLFAALVILSIFQGFIAPAFVHRRLREPLKIEIESNKITARGEVIDTPSFESFSRGNDLISDAAALRSHLTHAFNHLQQSRLFGLRPAVEITACRPDGNSLTSLEIETLEHASLEAGALAVKILTKTNYAKLGHQVDTLDVREVGIWFEDLTHEPDRLFSSASVPAAGMAESWFDDLVGRAEALERRYVAPGVLSGVKVRVRADQYEQFELTLRNISQRLGTNPWIRDLSEPGYAKFWESRRPFFPSRTEVSAP